MLSEQQIRNWVHFANLQLSARFANHILSFFSHDPAAVLAATDDELDEVAGLQERQRLKLRDPLATPAPRQMDWLTAHDVQLLVRGEPGYPDSLEEIFDPPPVLFVRGNLPANDVRAAAIVGSRSATPYGRWAADHIARGLAAQSIAVISGGALGIDAVAHRATLDAGGRTIAVLGCGLDVDYPRDNSDIFAAAVRQGAVVSEYAPGAPPDAWHFPQRNRIISGLSAVIVVVEAPERSGSLITARSAIEQGRTVMALPGNIDRETSRGTNELLKDGALLVTSVDDVLLALGCSVRPAHVQPALQLEEAAAVLSRDAAVVSGMPELRRLLFEILSPAPVHIDALAAAGGVPVSRAGVELTMLELAGLARRLPGNSYTRV